jgi:hypothetical protein
MIYSKASILGFSELFVMHAVGVITGYFGTLVLEEWEVVVNNTQSLEGSEGEVDMVQVLSHIHESYCGLLFVFL